jgi:deoxyhypusine synthase
LRRESRGADLKNHKTKSKRTAQYMRGKSIEPLELTGNERVVDLIDHVFARSGFNARRLAEAAQLFSRMLETDATVCLTLAGAMTPIGMSGPIIDLMKRGFVDFIISTGANIYHDMHRPYALPMCQGSHQIDDNDLADLGIARIYDVFIEDEDTLMATDKCILRAAGRVPDRPVSTAEFHRYLGDDIAETATDPDKSFVATAAKYDVPIYTSSPGDSSIGMNLIVPQMFRRPIQLDPVRDVIETAAIVRGGKTNGVLQLGGGSPKNFYLQTQPTLHQILLDKSKGGHDYFIQITTDSPHWGGLSGATPQEARSWGKIKDANLNNVVVYSCSSIAFPLIAQYALVRNKKRKLKRLQKQIPALVETMQRVASKKSELHHSLVHYFDAAPKQPEQRRKSVKKKTASSRK